MTDRGELETNWTGNEFLRDGMSLQYANFKNNKSDSRACITLNDLAKDGRVRAFYCGPLLATCYHILDVTGIAGESVCKKD